jgi:Protein of unknown function (DUF2971)
MNDPFELIGPRWSHIAIEQALTAHSTAEYGALCLSRNCSDPLLWTHYADKHGGICLGFDIPDDPHVVHFVNFADERELQDPYLLLKNVAWQPPGAALSAVMRKLLLKYKGWQYEDEVRLFKKLEKGLTFCLFDDEDLVLKQVILGLRCTFPRKPSVIDSVAYDREVEVLKATLSPYRFEILPIAM